MKKKKRWLSFVSAAAVFVALIAGSCLPAFAANSSTTWAIDPGVYDYTSSTYTPFSGNETLAPSTVVVNGTSYNTVTSRFYYDGLTVWPGQEIAVVLPYWFNRSDMTTDFKSKISVSFAVAGWSWEIMDSTFYSPWSNLQDNYCYRLLKNGGWSSTTGSSVFSPSQVENCYSYNTSVSFSSDYVFADGRMLFVLMLRRKGTSETSDLTIYAYDFDYDVSDKLSPEYPNYSQPDDSAFKDNQNKETQLKGETAAGLGDLSSTFTGFTDLITGFIPAMLFVSNVMSSFINKIPLFGLLIRISLALGMFAFLLGVGQHLVGIYRSRSSGAAHRRRRGDK